MHKKCVPVLSVRGKIWYKYLLNQAVIKIARKVRNITTSNRDEPNYFISPSLKQKVK